MVLPAKIRLVQTLAQDQRIPTTMLFVEREFARESLTLFQRDLPVAVTELVTFHIEVKLSRRHIHFTHRLIAERRLQLHGWRRGSRLRQ